MKRWIGLTLIGVLITATAYATIQRDRIADKIISRVSQIRSSSVSTYLALEDARNALIDLNTNFNAEIETTDVTRLTNLFSDITSARNALNTLISNIDTDFPSIQ